MNQHLSFRRTRIAPTPSGYLHLGNVCSFALTASLARQSGARILLRIDDLDRSRVRRAYVEDIFETLNYLELPWDEGPSDYGQYETTYSQRHRMPLYQDALGQLRRQGVVFACECSRTTLFEHHPQGFYTGTCRDKGLPLDGPGYNWRIHTADAPLPPAMHDFVVRKKDGFPAYQLTSLVDDVHFGVDLIVRGEDLFESTQAQTHLAKVLGYDTFLNATVHHHALLMAGQDEKLSKSTGATSIQYLRKQGKPKEDVYGMLGAMLGLDHPIASWQALGEAMLP
ncbi:glutamate--tRNA ligase family protein [Parapedobacter sp. DT-150]|uniref:glutamate--tRNA ligase family protein n=1 Tax=Parapedobacter sp. DT-150 TaxID=3396162 RepID=UPI003F1DFF60